MSLGDTIRQLRKRKGVGIKAMAPEVRVHHTYLSKIENGYVTPSAEVLERVADYLGCDKDELMLQADRIPDDIMDILRTRPREAMDFLRDRFGRAATHE